MGLRVDYNLGGNGFFGGAGWYRVKDFNMTNIFTGNIGYKFPGKLSIHGAYARNVKADFEKDSWQTEISYGDYDDAAEKGQWSVFLAYRKFGSNATLNGSVTDDVILGTCGWVIGASWAPFKNIGLTAKYFRGQNISENIYTGKHDKAIKFSGSVEIFF